ncbi:MAG: leucine-rich repeat domain-containing protein [Holosporales bacterium]|jgi:hypothetical protein|nr:leucine-rich repeat domain-containing protein [Holosporales bacterium]
MATLPRNNVRLYIKNFSKTTGALLVSMGSADLTFDPLAAIIAPVTRKGSLSEVGCMMLACFVFLSLFYGVFVGSSHSSCPADKRPQAGDEMPQAAGAQIERVGDHFSRNCRGLRDITIPSNVLVLERALFKGFPELVTVGLPFGLREIQDEAFSECKLLCGIYLPVTLSVIGRGAFAGSSLISIDLPLKIVSIPESCFEYCPLQTCIVRGTLRSIGRAAFFTTALTRLGPPDSDGIDLSSYPGLSLEKLAFGYIEASRILFPPYLPTVPATCCVSCEQLRFVCLPGYRTRVWSDAFSDCPRLELVSHWTVIPSLEQQKRVSLRQFLADGGTAELLVERFGPLSDLFVQSRGFPQCDLDRNAFGGDRTQVPIDVFQVVYNRYPVGSSSYVVSFPSIGAHGLAIVDARQTSGRAPSEPTRINLNSDQIWDEGVRISSVYDLVIILAASEQGRTMCFPMYGSGGIVVETAGRVIIQGEEGFMWRGHIGGAAFRPSRPSLVEYWVSYQKTRRAFLQLPASSLKRTRDDLEYSDGCLSYDEESFDSASD